MIIIMSTMYHDDLISCVCFLSHLCMISCGYDIMCEYSIIHTTRISLRDVLSKLEMA